MRVRNKKYLRCIKMCGCVRVNMYSIFLPINECIKRKLLYDFNSSCNDSLSAERIIIPLAYVLLISLDSRVPAKKKSF